jgi:4-hydroxy-tetrahydrodipicolinate reductase
MGRAVIALVAERNDVALAAATGRPGGGADASGGIALTSIDEMLEACEVVIDFSTAAASTDLARRAAERGGVALVLGATGFPDQDQAAIAAAAGRVAIIKSGNFSLGLNVLAGLVRQAAARLSPEDWDAEVLDWHHRRKIDAPSGTALLLGEAIAQGRGLSLSDVCEVGGRTGPRAQGAIGFAVLRGGGVVGEHTVALAAEDETITFSHSARDRGVFARGAIEAALWVRDKPPGLYGMQAVLGF